jgi:transposase
MAEARVVRPDRRQLRWDMIDLEGLLPADHRARLVWSFVESLDLSQLYDQVLSREGEAGRPAADPAVLLSLWLYATIEGVGSARELERLAQSDAAYRWLAGGVPLNYHGLADFRVDSVEVLDRLLTQSVTALIAEGLVSLAEIAVDGTKVRANASKGSFKTGEKLLKIEAAVDLSVWPPSSRSFRAIRGLRRVDGKPRGSARRVMFRSAPEERGRRSNGLRRSASRALRSTPRMKPKRRSPGLRRPIPTRHMRFPDGAVRPAYNAQIAAAPRGPRDAPPRMPPSPPRSAPASRRMATAERASVAGAAGVDLPHRPRAAERNASTYPSRCA